MLFNKLSQSSESVSSFLFRQEKHFLPHVHNFNKVLLFVSFWDFSVLLMSDINVYIQRMRICFWCAVTNQNSDPAHLPHRLGQLATFCPCVCVSYYIHHSLVPLDLSLQDFSNCKETELDLFLGFDIYFQLVTLNVGTSWVWRWTSVISVLDWLRQADNEFQGSLYYLVRPCAPKFKKKKKETQINKMFV